MRDDTYEKLCRMLAFIFILYYVILELYSDVKLFVTLFDFFMEDPYMILATFKYQLLEVFIMLLGLAALFALRKKGLIAILGICAIVIAFDCSLEAYVLLIDYRHDLNGIEFFTEGALSLLVAIMLFFNTVLFLRGLSKSANLIKYGVLILIILDLLSIIASLREGSVTFRDVFNIRNDTVPILLMLFLVLSMTSSRAIKQVSIMGNIGMSIRDMRNSMMEEGIGVDRHVAARFVDYNRNGLWCSEYSFMMTSFRGGRYSVALRPYNGKMMANISSIENRSGMNNFRFVIAGVWFDTGDVSTCDLMRFYSTDGLFIQLIVRDMIVPKPRKIPKIGMIVMLSKEVGTTTNRIRIKLIEIGYKFVDILQKLRKKVKR